MIHILGDPRVNFLQSYIDETRATRDFTPQLPVSPFDDFYIEIDIKYCPDWTPERTLSLSSKIQATLDALTSVVSPGSFELQGAANGVATYRWALYGWGDRYAPIGITTDSDGNTAEKNMDILAKAIVDGDVDIVVADTDPLAPDFQLKYWPLSMTDCVHVSGAPGKLHKIVQTRGLDSGLNGHALMSREADIEINGFLAVDPFRSLSGFFRHYVDLYEHNDWSWPRAPKGTSNYFTDDGSPSGASKCGSDGSLYMHHNGKSYFAYALKLPGKSVFLNPKTVLPAGYDNWAQIAMHEVGHAFCALQDEYDKGTWGFVTRAPNCSTNPEVDWRWDLGTDDEDVHWGGQIVGNTNYRIKGCGPLVWIQIGGENEMSYRPTNMSIMNTGPDTDADASRFNEVSCANCAYYIKRFQSPQDYLLKCRYDWNTVRSPIQ